MPGLQIVPEGLVAPVPQVVNAALAEQAAERAKKLEEAQRLFEAQYPAIIEVFAGFAGVAGATCSNYQVTTNTVGTNMANTVGTNMDTWPIWNIEYNTAATCGSITYGTTNGSWPFNTYSTTTNTNTNTVNHFAWNAWMVRYERIKEAGDHANQIQRYSRRKLSETELLAALEQEKKMREEAERRVLAAKLAEKRADDLLRLCLSPQQIEDFEKKNCFYIEVAGRGGKKERYRIDKGSHGNVKQVDEKGSIIRQFCIQPSGVPNGDVLLTQKLWLEASEETREKFWETANITTLMQEKTIPSTVPRHERRKYAEVHGLLH